MKHKNPVTQRAIVSCCAIVSQSATPTEINNAIGDAVKTATDQVTSQMPVFIVETTNVTPVPSGSWIVFNVTLIARAAKGGQPHCPKHGYSAN